MHSSFATVLLALASLKTAIAAPNQIRTDQKHRPTGPRYLNDLAQANGKLWFGTAADIPGTAEQTDKEYLRILTSSRNFGEITPANMMKVRTPIQNLFH
jgi:endo-1,4-beta-xylanase